MFLYLLSFNDIYIFQTYDYNIYYLDHKNRLLVKTFVFNANCVHSLIKGDRRTTWTDGYYQYDLQAALNLLTFTNETQMTSD